MNRLIEIGFKKVGDWVLSDNSFSHNIASHLNDTNLLYAFIVEQNIFYIGKTTNTLKNRMNGYRNANISQRTNIRVKGKILEMIKESKVVEIYILLDNSNIKYFGYDVSPASGLEDNLISAIKPEWNFRGNIRVKEQTNLGDDEILVVENNTCSTYMDNIRTVEIILGQEYFQKGFFNFSKNELPILPEQPTEVKILLGKHDDFVATGHFHFATQQNQPRVRGNKVLKQWFQDNFKQGDKIKIDIINKELYRIN